MNRRTTLTLTTMALLCLTVALPAGAALAQQTQPFPCAPVQTCSNLWVAAQNVGHPEAFFSRGPQPLNAVDIKIGDNLTANREINVRAGPADWQKPLFALERGRNVNVADLKQLLIQGGGSQIWIRIQAPGSAANNGPTQPTVTIPPISPVPPPVPPVATAAPPAPCLQLPANDSQSSIPIIEPPIGSIPPSPVDLARLLQGRDIYCDQYGLIVHKNSDGTFNGGDTAQREGWYWLGVWIRQNTPGLEKWTPTRKLSFDQVLALLEPHSDGVFYRHPKQEMYNNPYDKKYGFSRGQLISLVAAMGVWGKHDAIRRLWDALPEDILGKHSFNGNWRNFLGQDGPNCGDIKKRGCDATVDCSLKVDTRVCSAQIDTRDCSLAVDDRDCSAGEDQRSCGYDYDAGWLGKGHVNDLECEAEKAAQNAAYGVAKATCEAAKTSQNIAYSAAKATCEGAKTSQNSIYAALRTKCNTEKYPQNAFICSREGGLRSWKNCKQGHLRSRQGNSVPTMPSDQRVQR